MGPTKMAASTQMADRNLVAWHFPEILRRLSGAFMAKYLSILKAVNVKILAVTATPTEQNEV